MAEKMVQVGARVPQADALFITQYPVDGAKTPSDKLRTIVAEARRRHEGLQDYKTCFDLTNNMLMPFSESMRNAEMANNTHSELMLRVLEWLPDITAYLVSNSKKLEEGSDIQTLAEIERGLADRVFRLMESVLQMGVTSRCSCYEKNAMMARMEPILDLVRVIERTRAEAKQEKVL